MPRLPPPIWLEEIQSNKIFNKQRHKLVQEKRVSAVIERGEGRGEEGEKVGKEREEVGKEREEVEEQSIKENSKTESDQEEVEDLC